MNSLYNAGNEQIGRLFPTFSTSFFCFYFVEDLSHHFSRLIVACFDVFSSDSVAVWGFALFLSLLIAVRNSSVVISGILVISLVLLLCTSMLLTLSSSPISCSVSSCFLSSYIFCRILPRHWQSLFRDVVISPFLILYLGDEHSLLCRFDSWDVLYTFEIFKYYLDVLLSFHSFLSLIIFYAFAHSFQALFLFFGCVSSLLDESSDFNVFL